MMARLRTAVDSHPYLVAVVLAVALLVGNAIALPHASWGYWPGLVGNAAPFILVAVASTPQILGGGLDLSIGPQVVLHNILLLMVLAPAGLGSPAIALPILLVVGAAIGTVNGVLVAVLRFPPIIATLCTMFVLIGVDLKLAPQPGGSSMSWLTPLTSTVGFLPVALLIILVPVLMWTGLGRTAYVRNLLSAGDDQVAAYSAGVPVNAARMLSYTLGGVFASIAGITLASLLRSADSSQATGLVLVALAAVALGGTAFTGGRGSLIGSIAGAVCIFLIQNLLTALSISSLWVNVVYGVVLVAAVIGTQLHTQHRKAAA